MSQPCIRDRRAAVHVQRVDAAHLGRLLARCADVDRLFKGLRPRGADSDPWLELSEIAVSVIGDR